MSDIHMRRKSDISICCNPDTDDYLDEMVDGTGAGMIDGTGGGVVDGIMDEKIDSMISSLLDLSVKDTYLNIKEKACNTFCEVCKEFSNQKVSGLCPSNCIYFCHEKCFMKWIIDKRELPVCMKCKIPYDIEIINRIFFHANRLNQTYR